MGLQLPSRGVQFKRAALGATVGAALFLTGCSRQGVNDAVGNYAMPEAATKEAPAIHTLWEFAWIASAAVGLLVWGLIFYAMWRFRNRHDGRVPVQTRYNLPLEIFYTIAPVLMVVVFFVWTVRVQNEVTEIRQDPEVTIDVVGQQWSWTFNYTEQGEGGTTPYTSGDASTIPTLYLPVDKRVEFRLQSPDVIHSFGVPAFLQKLDVIPGRINKLQVTPNKLGTFKGKCYELCGTYHSRMLFNVEVVSQADYEKHLQELQDTGWVADEPVLGGSVVTTQKGLTTDEGAHE